MLKSSTKRKSRVLSVCLILVLLFLAAGMGTVHAATATAVYQVIQGHDGDPDPDDNLAVLVGIYAIKRNVEANPSRVQMVGAVYGDTTAARKTSMISGSGKGYGNYHLFLQYTQYVLNDAYGAANVHDCTTQTWNFNATSLSQLTTCGQMVYNKIKAAIDNTDTTKNYRVVYSAGGGHNAAYEAIKLLKSNGYTDQNIKDHFIIVQHSTWNMNNCNETGVLAGTLPFFQRIIDQNPYSGRNHNPDSSTVSVSKTSQNFYDAYWVAYGPDDTVATNDNPNIDHLYTTTDSSDSGSHRYASTPSLMDSNWSIRNNDSNQISFTSWNLSAITDAISGTSSGTSGLTGQYYDNQDLTSLKMTRTDATVNFDWGTGSPNTLIGADSFSVRWTGYVKAPVTGTYTFYVASNDGNRLWINNTQLTNRWSDGNSEQSGTISLTAGQTYPITLEMYEGVNSASCKLSWSYTGQAKQIVPAAQLSH
ncbi:PA14 domain-containing protein [Paenibacillus ferrarius]|uniref:PA14 domain-containing protein n=1 Tax=Paenibacillus ferrarius TaxID=1469647 RepID=UPI003D2CF73B